MPANLEQWPCCHRLCLTPSSYARPGCGGISTAAARLSLVRSSRRPTSSPKTASPSRPPRRSSGRRVYATLPHRALSIGRGGVTHTDPHMPTHVSDPYTIRPPTHHHFCGRPLNPAIVERLRLPDDLVVVERREDQPTIVKLHLIGREAGPPLLSVHSVDDLAFCPLVRSDTARD